MKVREQQKAETRQKILETARKLIEDAGYEAATIRSIAKAAEIASGTVFVHFENKEDLLYSAFYEDLEQIVSEALESIKEKVTLQEKLYGIGSYFINTFASRPGLYINLLDHSLLSRGEWGDKFRNQVTGLGMQVGSFYEKAKASGDIRAETDTRIAVTAFFSFYYFVLINALKSKFENTDEYLAMFAALLEQHLNGLNKE